jgi:hypothetical protein
MIASPLPNTKAPAMAKNEKSDQRVPPVVATAANKAARGTGEKGERLATLVFPFPPSSPRGPRSGFHHPDQETCGQEEQHLFGLRKDGHRRHHEVDPPEQWVTSNGSVRQLQGAYGDDTDYAGTNSVEHSLHPGKTTVDGIEPAECNHHQKRRPDKGQSHQGGSRDTIPDIAQVHGQLSSERARRKLGKCQSLFIVSFRNPASLLDEVTLHISNQRDRPAKAERPQAQEIPY